MARKIILSDETVNSKGFIVKTAGIHLARFIKNPVLLDSHDEKVILGKVANLKVEDEKLVGEPLFNEKNDHAKQRKQEFEDGFLNGTSAGLRPMGLKFMPEDFDFSGPVPVLLKSQLVEHSLCAVPSNENALGLSLYDNEGKLINDVEAMITEIKLSAQSPSHINLHDMDFKKQLAKNLGINENASDAEILAAQESQTKELDKVALSVKEGRNSRATLLVATAVKEGKLKAALKDQFVEKAAGSDADFDFIKLSFDNMDAAAPAGKEKKLADFIAELGKGGDKKNLSEERKNWDYMTWLEKAPGDLKLMESENKEAHEALLNAHIAKVQEKNGKV